MSDDIIIPAAAATTVLMLIAHDEERLIEDHLVPVIAWRISKVHGADYPTPISTVSFEGDSVMWLLQIGGRGRYITGLWGGDLVYTREEARALAKDAMAERIQRQREQEPQQ